MDQGQLKTTRDGPTPYSQLSNKTQFDKIGPVSAYRQLFSIADTDMPIPEKSADIYDTDTSIGPSLKTAFKYQSTVYKGQEVNDKLFSGILCSVLNYVDIELYVHICMY